MPQLAANVIHTAVAFILQSIGFFNAVQRNALFIFLGSLVIGKRFILRPGVGFEIGKLRGVVLP